MTQSEDQRAGAQVVDSELVVSWANDLFGVHSPFAERERMHGQLVQWIREHADRRASDKREGESELRDLLKSMTKFYEEKCEAIYELARLAGMPEDPDGNCVDEYFAFIAEHLKQPKPAGEAGGCSILIEAVALYVKAREDQEHASERMRLFYQMVECLKATRAEMRRREAKPPEPKTGEGGV